VIGSLGFENAYALAMKRDAAQAAGIASIADLGARGSGLRLAADLEFLDRPEWRTIRDAYGLRFADQRAYSPTFMYRAPVGGAGRRDLRLLVGRTNRRRRPAGAERSEAGGALL
jgi:osmoprotectant transport system permease protein